MGLKPTATRAFPAVAAFLLILTSQSLQAQQPSQDQIAAIRASCRSDFMANCSGVQPGGKDALECLKRNLARLSGSCQAAVSAIAPAAPAQP
ncbi:MAG: cysteine rich repeat-containing protein, partial [Xanthobacteraceae bacterium]